MEQSVDIKAARKAVWIGRIVFVWAVIIVGRLAYLQVIRHDEYVRMAKAQQRHRQEIPAVRGELLARDGMPLAISVLTESLVVNPRRIVNLDFFSQMVGPVIGEAPADLAARIREYTETAARHGRGGRSMVLRRHLDAQSKDRLRFLVSSTPIEFVPDSQREYPNGELAAHVVGSLDAEGNGNSGIEQKLNADLKGSPGQLVALTGSRGENFLSWVSRDSVQGVNYTLSIDRVIQHDTERYLADGVAASGAESGTAVVMDPRTGEVLALANFPTFDPRHEKPTEEEARVRHENIAVQIPCEPGSVMKMITITMGLNEGRFKPEDTLFCYNGAFPRPGRKPIHDTHRYGSLDVAGVLIKSSNIGVAQIAIAVGPEKLYEYLKKFGIGDRSGIELPSESRGMLRKQACADARERAAGRCWTPVSHEYIAFGHEVGATAVQLARAVSVVANGGMLVQPHLVIGRTRPRLDGSMEKLPAEVKAPERVLPATTCATMRRLMERVVQEGTGRSAAIPGYSVGGKTGSAQIFEHGAWVNKHNSSFIGFAPVSDPRVVVVVTMNHTPKLGAVAAAPVFKQVLETSLRVLRVPKDHPETDTKAQPAAPVQEPEEPSEQLRSPEPEPAVISNPMLLAGPRVPDFRGKSEVEAMRAALELGLPIETTGHGKARRQNPQPGAILASGERVRVEFSVRQ